MRVLILAAGKGSRFKRTELGPKALIKFKGKRLIDYILAAISKCGIMSNKIWIVVGHESERINKLSVKIIYNSQYEETNMLASVYSAKELFDGSSDILISYSDIIYEPRVLKKLIESVGDIVVVSDLNWLELWKLRMENYLEDAESFIFNGEKKLINIGKSKPIRNEIMGQYIGLLKISSKVQKSFMYEISQCFSDSILAISKSKNANLSITEFIQILIDKNWVIDVVECKNGWLEFDTRDDLDRYEANSKLKSIFNWDHFK
jgi:choline kinase